MDGIARQGKCIVQFPLASWRVAPDQRPIVMNFPKNWKCWFLAKSHTPQHQALRLPYARPQLQETSAWTTLTSTAQEKIEALPLESPAINAVLHWTQQFCLDQFRVAPKAPTAVEKFKTNIQALWDVRHQLFAIASADIYSLFQAWRPTFQLKRMKSALDQKCKQTRIQRIEQAVQQAEAAASAHNTRRLLQTIRQLCP